jgi:hypothetical protein
MVQEKLRQIPPRVTNGVADGIQNVDAELAIMAWLQNNRE